MTLIFNGEKEVRFPRESEIGKTVLTQANDPSGQLYTYEESQINQNSIHFRMKNPIGKDQNGNDIHVEWIEDSASVTHKYGYEIIPELLRNQDKYANFSDLESLCPGYDKNHQPEAFFGLSLRHEHEDAIAIKARNVALGLSQEDIMGVIKNLCPKTHFVLEQALTFKDRVFDLESMGKIAIHMNEHGGLENYNGNKLFPTPASYIAAHLKCIPMVDGDMKLAISESSKSAKNIDLTTGKFKEGTSPENHETAKKSVQDMLGMRG